MNKQEYLQRLAHRLSFYQGNTRDIVKQYSEIIDEMLDEGLSMDDVIRKLGRPAVLAEEIAEEFDLEYTPHVKAQTTMPTWAKAILIILAIMFLSPIILSILGIIFGIIIALIGAVFGIVFGGAVAGSAIIATGTLSIGFKIVAFITGIAAILATISLTVLFVTWFVQFIQFIVREISNATTKNNSRGGY